MSVKHFTIKDPATWYQPEDKQIFLGAVLDASNSETMSVGFAHYGKGETNEWTVRLLQAEYGDPAGDS